MLRKCKCILLIKHIHIYLKEDKKYDIKKCKGNSRKKMEQQIWQVKYKTITQQSRKKSWETSARGIKLAINIFFKYI